MVGAERRLAAVVGGASVQRHLQRIDQQIIGQIGLLDARLNDDGADASELGSLVLRIDGGRQELCLDSKKKTMKL